ncbi:MAG: poly-gamma-glutamate system protein [Bacteroidales bacterium]
MRLNRKMSRKDKVIVIAGILSGMLLTISVLTTPGYNNLLLSSPEERAAFELMQQTVDIISGEHNLIGPEISDITTTLGDQAAKGTSLHPAFASLIVKLLRDAGVKPGDTVAVGCSGSFPGLLIASLSAARAMNLHPVTILSLGSSSYGASDPDFTILDLHMMMIEKGLEQHKPVAVSPGGDLDTGRDFEPATLEKLVTKAVNYEIPLIMEPDLVKNRQIRDSLYSGGNPERIRAFINTGGGHVAMGTSSLSLLIKPGIIKNAKLPSQGSRGLIHDMLEKDIPVLHLLYIKGLATRYRIPYDLP